MKIPCHSGRISWLALAATLVPAVHLTGATWDGPNNGDYATATNWNPDGVPVSGDSSIASVGGITAIYSTAGNITSTGRLLIGSTGANIGTLTMQGSAGTLTFAGSPFNGANYIGVDGSTGTVNVNAGILALTGMTNGAGHLHIGSNGSVSNGTLNIGGGTVNVGTRVTMGVGYPGDLINTVASGNGNATLTISAGSLNIGSSTVADTDKGALYLKSPTGGTGSATVNLNGGTLNLTRFIIGGAGSSKTINFNGGTVQANAASTTFLPTGSTNNVTDAGGIIDSQGFNITMAAALTAATGSTTSTITKKGGGILTISGAGHTYAGTIVDGGQIDYTATDTYGNHVGSQHNLTINAGGLVSNSTGAGGFNTFQNLNLNGGELRATNTLGGTFQAYHLRGTVTVGGTTASTISDVGQANGAINIGGTTNLGGGVGANLVFNVADVTSLTADLTVSAKLKNSADAAFAALSTGITKTGVGTLLLSGVNSYTGATTVTTGTLQVDGSTAAGSTVGIGTAGTLSGSGTVNGNATLTGGGIINKSAGAIAGTLGVTGGFWNGAGSVTGAVTSSSGTFTVGSGANLTATSGVSATGGALVVNGTLTGTLNANSSTIISGIGTVTGNTTIQGTHNPGNSPGIQTFGANLAYTGGASVVNWELTNDTVTNLANPNAIFDQIIVGGNLDFTNLTTINLIFNGAGSGVAWGDSFWTTDQSWTLYDVTGTTSNFGNLNLTTINWLDGSGSLFDMLHPDGGFSLSQSGNDVLLNYAAIPEPNVAALLGGFGVLALLARRRK